MGFRVQKVGCPNNLWPELKVEQFLTKETIEPNINFHISRERKS